MTWCILRTSHQRTLRLTNTLKAVGIEVWAPTYMVRKHAPRGGKFTDHVKPLLAGIVFARIEYLGRLLELMHSPSADIRFTVLQRLDGTTPTATDAALQPLRNIEAAQRAVWEGEREAEAREARQKRAKSKARAYVMGQRVKVEQPAFAGLQGEIVEIRNNGDLVLEFSGFPIGVTISACSVERIHLSAPPAEPSKAA